MTLIERCEDVWTFAIEDWERAFLVAVLRHYPQVPDGAFSLSKQETSTMMTEAAELHRELLAGGQQYNLDRVRKFIAAKLVDGAQPEAPVGQQLGLTGEEADWLLRALNDVRVGSWIKLGRPNEATLREMAAAGQSPTSLDVMEFCGHVQSQLLEALRV